MNLVSLPVVEKMSLLGLTRSEKNSQLLSAIHSQLTTNPSGIERLIQVLNTKLNLQEIAERIEEKHQGELIDQDLAGSFINNPRRMREGYLSVSVCYTVA